VWPTSEDDALKAVATHGGMGRTKRKRQQGCRTPYAESKKAVLIAQDGPLILIPATTYVPTQLPVQYHRPGEA
jgi:hypothetical protein